MHARITLIALSAALLLVACTDDRSTTPDNPLPPLLFDTSLTLTVPDPPYDMALSGLADSRSWEGDDHPPAPFSYSLDDEAGAVLVATTHPDEVDFQRRVLVCAQRAANGPELINNVYGDSLDLGHAIATVSDEHHYNLPTCGVTDRDSLFWHENGWVLNATAMDGDVDNAQYVASHVRISANGVFDEPVLDAPWVVAGRLDAGWAVPSDHAMSHFERIDETHYQNSRQISARIVQVNAQQRHAVIARMSDDAEDIVSRNSSVPVYNPSDYSEPSSLKVDGRRVMVGAWGASSLAAVVTPDDDTESSVAMLIAGGTFPDPNEFAALLTRVRGIDAVERQAIVDATVEETRLPADSRFYPRNDGVLPILLGDGDDVFRALPFIRRDRLWHLEGDTPVVVDKLLLETGRRHPPNCGLYLLGDRTLQLDGTPFTVATVDVPICGESTFEHPVAILPSRPSGQVEVLVLAEPGVEIEVEVDGVVRPLPLYDIDVVATTPPPNYRTGPYDGGETWGRTIVDAPGGRDSIIIRSLRDGEITHERTANPFG